MFEIPISLEVGGEQLSIRNNGDYRVVLDCFSALNDVELTKEERVYSALIIFYEKFNTLEDLTASPNLNEAVKQMYWFFNCGDDKGVGAKKHRKLIDWEGDSQLIASAVNKVANTQAATALDGEGGDSSSAGAGIASMSNDGVSISYNVLSASQAVETMDEQIAACIQQYLGDVRNSLGRKVLYRGLYPGE